MKNSVVVSDTTTIIYMSKIGALRLVEFLFTKIYIPHEVYLELTRHGDHLPGSIEAKTCKWIIQENVKNISQVKSLQNMARADGKTLDQGESEAIILGKEMNADFIILDEDTGRTYAKREGLTPIGMLGILLKAKEANQIDNVRNYMDLLRGSGFHLKDNLYNHVLVQAGERQDIA